MTDQELWSTQQAAEYLEVTRQAVHALAQRGEIGRQVGRAWVFTRGELDAWLSKPRPLGGRPPKRSASPQARAVLA
jgi:excisionase family DNA binding protein